MNLSSGAENDRDDQDASVLFLPGSLGHRHRKVDNNRDLTMNAADFSQRKWVEYML